jgi:Mce-associated membrane protein
VTDSVRQNAADKQPNPVNEDRAPTAAADIRAMAEQADAEAAEAEALAVAARARARAIQLRQQAKLVEAKEKVETVEPPADEPAKSDAEEAQPESQPEDVRSEGLQVEEDMDDTVAEHDASDLAPDAAADGPAWYRRWRRPRLSTVAAIVAVIVIFASLAASGYMIWEHRSASQQHQRAAEFTAAASQGVVTLTSLDFNHAKQDVQRVIDNSTGAFMDDFQKTADDFTKVVEQSKVVERGTVAAAAVDLGSMTKDSAVVLVASTSEVTNAAGAKQDPRKFRLIVTVSRDGDQLKMSKVEFVP